MIMLKRLMCWLLGHKWVLGNVYRTSVGIYSTYHCKRCLAIK